MAYIKEPSSLPEVENLIHGLYEPVSPAIVSQIQDVLHRIQRSNQAWALARDLLSRPDEKVRFFGALTLIVKLNTDSSSLGGDELSELFTRLLGWFTESALDTSSGLVTRKLSTALVTFFLHFPTHCYPCLRYLICCLQLRRHAHPNEIGDALTFIPNLEPRAMQACLLFATDLVEEAAKVDMNSVNHLPIYEEIRDSIEDVAALISLGLDPERDASSGLSLRRSAIKCLQPWASFAYRSLPRSDPLLEHLRNLIPQVVDGLAVASDDATFAASMELLSELLSNHHGFLTVPHIHLLMNMSAGPVGIRYYDRLIQGDFDFENLQFGLFMIALADSQMDTLLAAEPDPLSEKLLESVCGLLAAKGFPTVDDRIFTPAVEFWSTYVESMADFGDGQEALSSKAKTYATQAVHFACQKIVFPPPQIISEWDSTEREGFMDARKDVADLLQSMYAISGNELVSIFVDLAVQATASQLWAGLEAAAFCLGAFADCIASESACDDALGMTFSPSFFGILRQDNQNIPLRTRQSCIALIEKFAEYFERNVSSLPDALNLLFSVLGDPLLAGPASKSIYKLCSSCRTVLVSEAGTFLAEYRRIIDQAQLDCLANERITGAIGSVIQAFDNNEAQVATIHQLLDIFSVDAQRCILAARSTELVDADSGLRRCGRRCLADVPIAEIPLHVGLRVLRCLVNLGKGLQAPADVPVDLDTDKTNLTRRPDTEPFSSVHSRILTIISELQVTFPSSGEVIESICNIFRAGFSETVPGPFVFPLATISGYLTQQPFSTARIGALISMACSFVSSSTPRTQGWSDVMPLTLSWIIRLVRELPSVDFDPELSQHAIDFCCRLFVKDPGLVLLLEPQDSIAFFFSFTLTVLDSQEPLPKAAAAEFWATFAGYRAPNQHHQELIQRVMQELGPLFMLSLMRNIGGNASRSELDKLSEPLKKIASLHPMAQAWMRAALLHPSFPSQNISEEAKLSFARKVISLRGARQTNQVVREFWLASRGSKFTYAT